MEIESLGLPPGVALGISSFVASSHPADSCGLNGLPLTPNSISILGNAQILKIANHPNLAKYLDVMRGKHQRIVVVSEFWQRNLRTAKLSADAPPRLEEDLLRIVRQILSALAYLNQMNIVHLNLRPDTVMLDHEDNVKLFAYGLARMTDYGRLVAFPIGDPRLTAPEVFLRGSRREAVAAVLETELERHQDSGGDVSSSATAGGIAEDPGPPDLPQADVWSLGMMLASMLLNIPFFWPQAKIGQIIRKVVSLGECENGCAVLEKLAREHACLGRINTLSATELELLHRCLDPVVERRLAPAQLLQSELLVGGSTVLPAFKPPAFPTLSMRCARLELPVSWRQTRPLDYLQVREIYYLWQLAGGDVFAELRKHGLMVTTPPIISIPSLVVGEGQEFGVPRQRAALFDTTIITLPIEQLVHCLSGVPKSQLSPCLGGVVGEELWSQGEKEDNKLPLIIRERDVRYQCRRAVLFRRFLQGYPFRCEEILAESLSDVVPLYRAEIWAALLHVDYDVAERYAAIDKETWNPVDRQIEVDIPRCHQYNELLASEEGHRKLKRVLKAWVVDNPKLVYWQGLDSLAAPFLFLNFNNEALAWACLSAFIPKYLYNMFQKDNAAVIQEYLAKFSHLQAFHDPVLFNHLDDIGFIPDLYAIPWVLTMFSHVFPLHKIFHLWDRLLLGDSSFPLHVGLAVLLQLRASLMEAQFNECILLFSEMPAVDIDQVVSQSMDLYLATPPSLTFRAEDRPGDQIITSGELSMQLLPVHQLKAEKVGRISAADVIQFLRTGPVTGRPRVQAVDVRPREEVRLGTLPGALNIPASTLLHADTWQELLAEARGRQCVLAVVSRAEDGGLAVQAAEVLLRANCPRVAVVHGGIEAFRGAGILVVPDLL